MSHLQRRRCWRAPRQTESREATRGRLARCLLTLVLALVALTIHVPATRGVARTNHAGGNRVYSREPEFSKGEPFRSSTAALYEPGASRSFLLRAPGDIDNGEWSTVISMTCDGRGPSALGSIRFISPGVPVALLDQTVGGVRFQLSAVLISDSAISAPAASVRVSAFNLDKRTHIVRIGASFDQMRLGLGFAAPDAKSSTGWSPHWAAGDPHVLAHGLRERAVDDTSTDEIGLAPGESVRVRFLIPAYAETGGTLRRIAGDSHEMAIQRAVQRWATALDSGLALGIPDTQTAAAFRSAVSVLLGCTQVSHEHTISIGNPFQYRDVWLRDGSRCASSLAVAGHTAIARRIVRGFLAYQWPQGPFLSQRGQLDGTGHVLWAMGQACLRPGPAADIRTMANAGLAAWRWSESERTATQLLGMRFGGLLPPCEPRDNELQHGVGSIVGADAWTMAGYEALARLLAADGKSVLAREVLRSREAYRKRFEHALDAGGWLRVPPTWEGIGEDWGNLSVAYPCRVLAAADSRVIATVESARARSPIRGLVRYGSNDTVHTYLAADVAQTELLRGFPDHAGETLRALQTWRTASGGGPEAFASDSLTFGSNFPPHATTAAALVSLIRNMLIFDDSDTLMLTLGTPVNWWSHSSVRRAPTRWGKISLEFERRGDTFVWQWTPVPVPTLVRLPSGFHVAGSLSTGASVTEAAAAILAPPGTSSLKVRARRGGTER